LLLHERIDRLAPLVLGIYLRCLVALDGGFIAVAPLDAEGIAVPLLVGRGQGDGNADGRAVVLEAAFDGDGIAAEDAVGAFRAAGDVQAPPW
jgi:hypothetical protein